MCETAFGVFSVRQHSGSQCVDNIFAKGTAGHHRATSDSLALHRILSSIGHLQLYIYIYLKNII